MIVIFAKIVFMEYFTLLSTIYFAYDITFAYLLSYSFNFNIANEKPEVNK